jgi:hypothetical protein
VVCKRLRHAQPRSILAVLKTRNADIRPHCIMILKAPNLQGHPFGSLQTREAPASYEFNSKHLASYKPINCWCPRLPSQRANPPLRSRVSTQQPGAQTLNRTLLQKLLGARLARVFTCICTQVRLRNQQASVRSQQDALLPLARSPTSGPTSA